MKPNHFVPCSKINLKWFKDLNGRTEAIKLLEENKGGNSLTLLLAISFCLYILEQGSKWDYIKLKCFCTAKETINKRKRQPTELEDIVTNDTFDKQLIPNIYKELTTLNTKKTT